MDHKKKPAIYNKTFVKIYNWCYKGQAYKIHEIIKLKKYLILIAMHSKNLGSQ